MIVVRTVVGPLDEEQLGWVARLYGPIDRKYASLDYLRHQLSSNPAGSSIHAFAIAEEGAVGHCCAIPLRARLAQETFTVGKVEALIVTEPYRGRRGESGSTVALDMLNALFASAHGNGIRVLFALAPLAQGLFVRAGCALVELDAPAYVLVTSPRAFAKRASRSRRLLGAALFAAQTTVLEATYATARLATRSPRPAHVDAPTSADADLVASQAAEGRWTVSGDDAWPWYAGSGVLQAIEVGGRYGSRAIVRLDRANEAPLQIVAWRPARRGLVPALLLLGAAARLARRNGAPTLRFQPWAGSGGDRALTSACKALGFIRRKEVDLLLHPADPAPANARVQLTPFFYVTF